MEDEAPGEPAQRLFGLQFADPAVENAYWTERVGANRRYFRTLALVLFAVYLVSWISNETGGSWPLLPPSEMPILRGFSIAGGLICVFLLFGSTLGPTIWLLLAPALIANQLVCYFLTDRAQSLGYFMGLLLTIVGVVGLSRLRVVAAAILAAMTVGGFVAGELLVGDFAHGRGGLTVYVVIAAGLSFFVTTQQERLTRLAYSRRAAVLREKAEVARLAEALRQAHKESEGLLLNMLPAPIAGRLKANLAAIAESFDEATIVFADISGFTALSAGLDPFQLVALLNQVFSAFDEIANRHGLEKIKTIGDAYMAAAGVPQPRADHAETVMKAAIEMAGVVSRLPTPSGVPLVMRIGIHSGPVVAGVIGTKRLAYDLWGDAVNTASRMESHGEPGAIQVSDHTRVLLGDRFPLIDRGVIEIKGKGRMRTWLWKAT